MHIEIIIYRLLFTSKAGNNYILKEPGKSKTFRGVISCISGSTKIRYSHNLKSLALKTKIYKTEVYKYNKELFWYVQILKKNPHTLL